MTFDPVYLNKLDPHFDKGGTLIRSEYQDSKSLYNMTFRSIIIKTKVILKYQYLNYNYFYLIIQKLGVNCIRLDLDPDPGQPHPDPQP